MKNETIFWKTKSSSLQANTYSVMRNLALQHFKVIERKSKRKPYVRSKYFKKQKIFFDFFWIHLFEKNPKDRTRRLKFLPNAIELIENSTYPPRIVFKNSKETLYRFYGMNTLNQRFVIQIKETSRDESRYLISVFPWK